jgi:hypothetical protein
VAVLAIPLVAAAPGRVVGLSWSIGVVVAVAIHPPMAAYVLLAVTPLVVGMDRGDLVPLLRPNEAVLALLAAGMAVHLAARLMTGRPIGYRRAALDVPLIVLTIAGSVAPLVWLLARGETVIADDVLYATTFWKYLGVYFLVRLAVTTEGQVRVCLWLSMASGALVAVIGLLQSLQLFGVPGLLARHYAPFEDAGGLYINRGTSTIAHAHAAADVLTFNLAIAVALLVRGRRHRLVLLTAAALFFVGVLASGTFSGVLALFVGVTAVGLVTGQLGRAARYAVPGALIAAVLLQPVIDQRLSKFTPNGVPSSWVARLENLRLYFWPDLFTDYHWLLGVRPAGRVPAPEEWRDWIFIESGHTWLLWVGGVPLLLAFVGFVIAALRALVPIARARLDAVGAAATAASTAVVVIAVLMTFDPHLTLRGTADLAFPLLALAAASPLATGRDPGGAAQEPD